MSRSQHAISPTVTATAAAMMAMKIKSGMP
jgi:hypothetical protein